jgi:hypothetical protein
MEKTFKFAEWLAKNHYVLYNEHSNGTFFWENEFNHGTSKGLYIEFENECKDIFQWEDKLENNKDWNKPKQYQIGIDTFQRAESNLSKEEILAICKFNIDKYCWRKKDQDKEDFKKIIDYANWAIRLLDN